MVSKTQAVMALTMLSLFMGTTFAQVFGGSSSFANAQNLNAVSSSSSYANVANVQQANTEVGAGLLSNFGADLILYAPGLFEVAIGIAVLGRLGILDWLFGRK